MVSLRALASRKAIDLLASQTGLPQKAAQLLFARMASSQKRPCAQGFAEGEGPRPKPLSLKKIEALLEKRAPLAKAELAWISPEAATASLGQVHKARLRDGRTVAVKVQYPGLAKKVTREVSWLVAAAKHSPARASGMDLDAHGASLACQLSEELDYLQEARQLRVGRALADSVFLGSSRRLLIPEPFEELSTRDVLVMEWLPFESSRQASAWEPRVGAQVLEDVFLFTLASFFSHGRLYADAHFGNVGRAGEHTAIVDFGVFSRLEERCVEALKGLVLSVWEERGEPLWPYFERAGFSLSEANAPEWRDLAGRLPALCEALVLPFRGPAFARPDDFQVGTHARAILGADAWTFRASGPPWFFGVMRLLGCLFALARHVAVAFRARDSLEKALSHPGLPAWRLPVHPHGDHHGLSWPVPHTPLARLLRVQLMREGREVVCVEMPARASFRLESLLGDDVRKRIVDSGRSPQLLQQELLGRGLVPGEVLREKSANGTLVLTLV